MDKKDVAKYTFYALIIALFVGSLAIALPFFSGIVFGLILAYLFYPIHKKFCIKLNSNVSAGILCILAILFFTVPIYLSAFALTKDVGSIYTETRDRVRSGVMLPVECDSPDNAMCVLARQLNTVVGEENIRTTMSKTINTFISAINAQIGKFILSIPMFLVQVTIFLFVMFFSLRDGAGWVKYMRTSMPLVTRHRDVVYNNTQQMLDALLYGQIITSIVQGVIGGIGFWIFGVDSPIFWGVMMAFLAVLPVVGPWVIYIPAGLGMLVDGFALSDNALVFKAVLFFVYSLVMVSLSDNFLRMYLVADKAQVHPLIILIGVFGGMFAFGVTGFILGPLVLSLFLVMLDLSVTELKV